VRPAALKLSRAVVLLAALLISLTACGSASATRPCWKQVQDDWTNNRLGSTTYAPSCYDQAIKHLGRDVFYYSNAVDEIHAAKQAALREKEKPRHTAGVPAGSNNSGNGGEGGTSSEPGSPDGGTDSTVGPIGDVLNAGSTSSDGMPLPLIILGGLALALVAAGAFGVVSRRRNGRNDPV
jgi:hypothetical protein